MCETSVSILDSHSESEVSSSAKPAIARLQARGLRWGGLLVAGCILAGAWLFQQRYLAVHQLVPDAPDVSALDPQMVELGKRSVALQAELAKKPHDVKKRWDLIETYQKLGQPQFAKEHLEIIARRFRFRLIAAR